MAVVDHVVATQSQFAAVLATGDIAQDASPEAYAFYDTQVSRLQAPIHYLPGNHDELVRLNAIAASQVTPVQFTLGQWQIIMLNSAVHHEIYGQLNAENLQFLSDTLASVSEQTFVLICLHHHPIPCGANWLDDHNLKNSAEFWARVEPYPQVRGVVWGHIHQEFAASHRRSSVLNLPNIACFATPSTCIQFKPQVQEFALDNVNCGYRLFELYPDGRLVSEVVRIKTTFRVDMQSQGY